MENFENLTKEMPVFYRQHDDVVHGGKVDTLTEAGLATYFYRRKREEPEVFRNSDLLIDFDMNGGSSFSETMRGNLRTVLSENCEDRRFYIVHRDGHTVSLIRENNTFLLLDSYNANGTTDHDHFPLLTLIREQQPNAKIYTLRDKIQNDYNNCRIFAVENAAAIERYCQQNNCGLSRVIQEAQLVPALFNSDDEKDGFYNNNNITSLGTPLPIVPHIQSMAKIRTVIGSVGETELITERLNGHIRNRRTNEISNFNDNEARNDLISNISKENSVRIRQHNCLIKDSLPNDVSQRTFVERLRTLEDVRNNNRSI